MSTALSSIDQRIHELIGDYISVALTTALTTSTSVVSTNLNAYDDARNDKFIKYWCYVTDKANAAQDRYVYDYTTATGTLAVRGANFVTDGANLATIRLYKYSFTNTLKAINSAIRELGDVLFKTVDDQSLISGNILPNSHFDQWTASTIPDFHTIPTGSAAEETTTTWGEGSSMKVTAGAASDYVELDSDDYPRLLDLKDRMVSLRCMVSPEVADDAYIEIYTKQADGTEQTLTSTTSCPAGEWTLLELENQTLNDDLVKVAIRFGVTTNTKYAYFDNARLTGFDVHEYYLPEDFQDGDLKQVYIQTSGVSEFICDDIHPQSWERIYGWKVIDDGTYKYLRLSNTYPAHSKIRLFGTSPLAELTTYASTTEIDDPELQLLCAYAAYKLFVQEEGLPSAEDKNRFQSKAYQWLSEYYRLLPRLRMIKPKKTMMLNYYGGS